MDYIKAFIVGGIFCVIAQILIDKCKLTPARILVIYVVAGAFLTVVGVYKPLVEFAGCGATIPITGFGYSLAEGAKKAYPRNYIEGLSGENYKMLYQNVSVAKKNMLCKIAKNKDVK